MIIALHSIIIVVVDMILFNLNAMYPLQFLRAFASKHIPGTCSTKFNSVFFMRSYRARTSEARQQKLQIANLALAYYSGILISAIFSLCECVVCIPIAIADASTMALLVSLQ